MPLRAIPASEIEHYAFKALTTWGALEDYKYFLPRIFELTDQGSLLCDIEVTLGKFAYGGFGSWPRAEREAIQGFIMSSWRDSISAGKLHEADAWLCGAALLIEDITPLLDVADMIAPDFKSSYGAEYSNQTKRKLHNSFWDDRTSNYQRVLAWLYPSTSTL